MAAARLRARVIISYGLPGLVTALPVIPVSVLLPAYYAIDLGLGLSATGLALAGARLVDFLCDPLAGALIDRAPWQRYRYKPWMVFGSVLAGLALWRLAWPQAPVGIAALAGWSVLLFCGWTLLTLPYCAWGAELSAHPHDRSLLAGSRELAGALGMLLALLLPAVAAAQPALSGMAPLALVAAAALVLGVPALTWSLSTVPEPRVEPGRTPVTVGEIVGLLRVRSQRALLGCWFTNGVANGLPAVLFPLVAGGYFGLAMPAQAGLLAGYFGSAVLATPVWLLVSRRIGKLAAWRASLAGNCLVFAPVLALGPDGATAFGAICLLSGAMLGADLALPAALQADVLAADREISGKRRAASAFALWSMATKLALALAVGLAFVTLGGATAAGASGPPSVLLLGLYACVPVLLKILVLAYLGRDRAIPDAAPAGV